MTITDAEAIDAVHNMLGDLVPQPTKFSVRIQQISPTGLNDGYIAEHRNSEGVPIGDLYGRLVVANVVIQNNQADTVLPVFLGLSRQERAQNNILRLKLLPRTEESMVVELELLYEFIKVPDETEGGIIEEVDITLATKNTDDW